jgi:AraC-like DNA-binding protein
METVTANDGTEVRSKDWGAGAAPTFSHGGPQNRALQVEELLDDVRIALERDPRAAREAAVQLVAHLSQPVALPRARGGLAPWQMRKIELFLNKNLDRPLRVNVLAEQVMLSVSHFSHAFKESFGAAPHAYIVRLRLEQARRLMLRTGDPLSQIALACGFADQAHFSRHFRRKVGDTPNAWRRRNLTNDQIARRGVLSKAGALARASV